MSHQIIEAREQAGWCGPAALAFVASELGLPYPRQKAIAALIYDAAWGTRHEAMLKGCRCLGLVGEWVQESLEELMERKAQGASIIVNWMSGSDTRRDGHYSVLIDSNDGSVWLQDPAWIGSFSEVPRAAFEREWFDMDEAGNRLEHYALVVTKD